MPDQRRIRRITPIYTGGLVAIVALLDQEAAERVAAVQFLLEASRGIPIPKEPRLHHVSFRIAPFGRFAWVSPLFPPLLPLSRTQGLAFGSRRIARGLRGYFLPRRQDVAEVEAIVA